VFGAEQIQESKLTSRYFDKYVAAASSGTIIAILIIPYIQDNIAGHYYISYLIAVSMLFVASVLFILGYRYYIHANSNETVITKCIPVVIDAFKSWYNYKKGRVVVERKLDPDRLNSSLNYSTERLLRMHRRPSTFLDFAKTANTGKFNEGIVDDIKTLRRAFIVFILLIPYWLVYNQVN
jgi:dipeptide/tripeptide permease